jgi:hypothetical protein
MNQTIESYMTSLTVTPGDMLSAGKRIRLGSSSRTHRRNQEIIRLFFEEQMDLKDIAQRFGVAICLIRKIIKESINKVYLERKKDEYGVFV